MARIPLQPETRAARAMALTVMALMVTLAIVALAGAAALRHADLGWRAELAGRWTVEIGAPDRGAADNQGPAVPADIDRVLASLRATPGVVQARVIAPDEVRRLLQPWLGDADAIAELPLPVLIDVAVDPIHPPAPGSVERNLAAIAPGARLDDHAAWTTDLVRLLSTGETLGLALFGIIALITALMVGTAARARLAANRQEIELLHALGASDGYIARQFQAGAFRSALAGALIGAVLAGAAGVAMMTAGRKFAPFLPRLLLTPQDWALLVAAPAGAVLLATLVARGAALALVRRLP